VRAAPAVSVRCTGGWFWRALRVLTPAAAAGALAMWGLGHAGAPPTAALAIVLATVLGVAAAAWWRTAPVAVTLSWDGLAWAADGAPGRLEVMLDLGPWLLLRLQPLPAGPVRWLAVSAGEVAAALHGLRAAVYCRPPQPARRVRPAAPGGPSQPD
jgi:hypothetical protein